MPSREVNTATREGSTPSESSEKAESEKSFVSAFERALSRPTEGSGTNQSATVTPSSPHRSLAHANSTSPPRQRHIKTSRKPSSLAHSGYTPFSSAPCCPTTPLSPPVGFDPTQQPGASGADPRSLQTRRPPASRSSYGIETKSGPPPALSTQRSYTESLRRNTLAANVRPQNSPVEVPPNSTNSIDSVIKPPWNATNEKFRAQRSEAGRGPTSRPATSDGVMTDMAAGKNSPSGSGEERDSTLRVNGQHLGKEAHMRDFDGREHSHPSHEDLFLNLARDDTIDRPPSRNERRRSRIGTSSFSHTHTSRPSSSGRPSTSGGTFGEHQISKRAHHSHKSSFDTSISPSTEKTSMVSPQDPLPRNRLYAASAHPLDQRQQTRKTRSSFGSKPLELSNGVSPETAVLYGRRRSLRERSPGTGTQHYKQSNLPLTPNGDYGSSPTRFSAACEPESVRGLLPTEGTESTVSTTATSTVWDELDDLKSRLRKLELTGLLPKSSNAAMTTVNGDRPPTATTTVTTISSSPKRHQMDSTSPEASTIKGSGLIGLHPLLHSAMAKAKPKVNHNLYHALEATASDALALAAMTGSSGVHGASSSQASVIGSGSGVDRALRRKAESMCRSLTELCIALAEDSSDIENAKHGPETRDTASKDIVLFNSKLIRGSSEEPEIRTSSRVMSRLEARRTSLLGSSPLNGRKASPQEARTPTQVSTPTSSRLDKDASTLLLRKRSTGEDTDISSSRRPPSRAATEVGQVRPSLAARISREYTSQHPMPGSSQQSPSVQPSLPTRKSYFTSASSSPLTPSVQPGNRRYLDRSTPPSSADSVRLAEARQRRIASLGQGQSRIGFPSGRTRQSQLEEQH